MQRVAIVGGGQAGLPVAYVTEDTTRSRPEVLTTLFRAAIDHGAVMPHAPHFSLR